MYLASKELKHGLLAFNGELASMIVEADTSEGYIVQLQYTGESLRKEGRVDYLGNTEKDSQKTLSDRYNQVRKELGLEPFDLYPFAED